MQPLELPKAISDALPLHEQLGLHTTYKTFHELDRDTLANIAIQMIAQEKARVSAAIALGCQGKAP